MKMFKADIVEDSVSVAKALEEFVTRIVAG
jgi:hypothetical protein